MKWSLGLSTNIDNKSEAVVVWCVLAIVVVAVVSSEHVVCAFRFEGYRHPSKTVFAQEVGLPHVLAFGKVLGNLDLAEVLDALLQLLFGSQLFFRRPLLTGAGVPGTCGERPEKVALATLLGLLLLQEMLNGAFLGRPVQRLHVRLSADRAADDGTLRGAGLRMAL